MVDAIIDLGEVCDSFSKEQATPLVLEACLEHIGGLWRDGTYKNHGKIVDTIADRLSTLELEVSHPHCCFELINGPRQLELQGLSPWLREFVLPMIQTLRLELGFTSDQQFAKHIKDTAPDEAEITRLLTTWIKMRLRCGVNPSDVLQQLSGVTKVLNNTPGRQCVRQVQRAFALHHMSPAHITCHVDINVIAPFNSSSSLPLMAIDATPKPTSPLKPLSSPNRWWSPKRLPFTTRPPEPPSPSFDSDRRPSLPIFSSITLSRPFSSPRLRQNSERPPRDENLKAPTQDMGDSGKSGAPGKTLTELVSSLLRLRYHLGPNEDDDWYLGDGQQQGSDMVQEFERTSSTRNSSQNLIALAELRTSFDLGTTSGVPQQLRWSELTETQVEPGLMGETDDSAAFRFPQPPIRSSVCTFGTSGRKLSQASTLGPATSRQTSFDLERHLDDNSEYDPGDHQETLHGGFSELYDEEWLKDFEEDRKVEVGMAAPLDDMTVVQERSRSAVTPTGDDMTARASTLMEPSICSYTIEEARVESPKIYPAVPIRLPGTSVCSPKPLNGTDHARHLQEQVEEISRHEGRRVIHDKEPFQGENEGWSGNSLKISNLPMLPQEYDSTVTNDPYTRLPPRSARRSRIKDNIVSPTLFVRTEDYTADPPPSLWRLPRSLPPTPSYFSPEILDESLEGIHDGSLKHGHLSPPISLWSASFPSPLQRPHLHVERPVSWEAEDLPQRRVISPSSPMRRQNRHCQVVDGLHVTPPSTHCELDLPPLPLTSSLSLNDTPVDSPSRSSSRNEWTTAPSTPLHLIPGNSSLYTVPCLLAAASSVAVDDDMGSMESLYEEEDLWEETPTPARVRPTDAFLIGIPPRISSLRQASSMSDIAGKALWGGPTRFPIRTSSRPPIFNVTGLESQSDSPKRPLCFRRKLDITSSRETAPNVLEMILRLFEMHPNGTTFKEQLEVDDLVQLLNEVEHYHTPGEWDKVDWLLRQVQGLVSSFQDLNGFAADRALRLAINGSDRRLKASCRPIPIYNTTVMRMIHLLPHQIRRLS